MCLSLDFLTPLLRLWRRPLCFFVSPPFLSSFCLRVHWERRRERERKSFILLLYVQLPLFCLLSKDCCNGVGVFPTGNGRESTRPQLLSEIEAESGALSLSAKAAGGGGGGNVTILFGKRHVALLYACSSSSSQVCKSSCVASSLHRLWDA